MSNNIEAAVKNFKVTQNVSFRVIDQITGKIVQEVRGHNAATNSMLQGIAHYLIGDGVLNQADYTLARYIPRYISLGTMGLYNQDADENGLPLGIGGNIDVDRTRLTAAEDALSAAKLALDDAARCPHGELVDGVIICRCYSVDGDNITFSCDVCNDTERRQGIIDAIHALQSAQAEYDAALEEYNNAVADKQAEFFTAYMNQAPGYGADGYDQFSNNERQYFGLGPKFKYRPNPNHTANCELINDKFPRTAISFRQIIPETQAELPETIDVVYSAMISTGALAQFREPGKKYIFITEAGLWSKKDFVSGGDNGLLAGYRLAPPDDENWDMYIPDNRELLRRSILRVGINQVVQVIWKIQLGAIGQFINIEPNKRLYFTNVPVEQSAWVADTTYSEAGYMYKCVLSCPNVKSDMLPTVIFNTREVISGNYSNICDSDTDEVTIYAKEIPNYSFVIPTIYAEEV